MISTTIPTLPEVLPFTSTYFEDISNRNNTLVTITFPLLNTWAGEVNATATAINNAANSVATNAAIVQAIANFTGLWSSTTEYTVPSSVLYNGVYYLALQPGTNHLPTDTAFWFPIYQVTFSDILGKPTTIAGYGITDAYTKTQIDTLATLAHADSATGVVFLSSGTTAQRPVLADGVVGIRYNTTLMSSEIGVGTTGATIWNIIADITNSVLLTTNQTIAGIKTFTDNIILGSGKDIIGNNTAGTFSTTFNFGEPTAQRIITAPDANGIMATQEFATAQDFGIGQTVQDVTASRSLGVTYTNTSAKGRQVNWTGLTSAGTVSFLVNGVNIATFPYISNGYVSFYAVVPPGATYQVTNPGGVSTTKWSELF